MKVHRDRHVQRISVNCLEIAGIKFAIALPDRLFGQATELIILQ